MTQLDKLRQEAARTNCYLWMNVLYEATAIEICDTLRSANPKSDPSIGFFTDEDGQESYLIWYFNPQRKDHK